ncbi:MAG: lipocalin-like domain-containing protein [Reyranella sp.]|uniref:lipocalin-like domain-containing protein n=1 Tax=Reyranella sp. TaxID=1929291 RepID=UPI001AD090DC|nr:lipocalin-like domain-containing protein [Reyranella sp.]MBN9085325.1 lipocalin-like domain-containing protein [Reyranella sp.]
MRELLGGWRLESWSFVYEDGRPPEYPMGPDAKGYILYTPTGQVSATIMRADRSECFAYAGRYEIADGTVFHSIELSTNPALIGVRSTRRIALDGDRLTLSGPDFLPGTKRSQQIVWRRA